MRAALIASLCGAVAEGTPFRHLLRQIEGAWPKEIARSDVVQEAGASGAGIDPPAPVEIEIEARIGRVERELTKKPLAVRARPRRTGASRDQRQGRIGGTKAAHHESG